MSERTYLIHWTSVEFGTDAEDAARNADYGIRTARKNVYVVEDLETTKKAEVSVFAAPKPFELSRQELAIIQTALFCTVTSDGLLGEDAERAKDLKNRIQSYLLRDQ